MLQLGSNILVLLPIVIAAKDNCDNIFADVMNVTFNSGYHHGSNIGTVLYTRIHNHIMLLTLTAVGTWPVGKQRQLNIKAGCKNYCFSLVMRLHYQGFNDQTSSTEVTH
jgi:hypothetical protein